MSVFLFEKEYCLLEPCEGKLSRTVLRGESTRKGADLPDPISMNFQYLAGIREQIPIINIPNLIIDIPSLRNIRSGNFIHLLLSPV